MYLSNLGLSSCINKIKCDDSKVLTLAYLQSNPDKPSVNTGVLKLKLSLAGFSRPTYHCCHTKHRIWASIVTSGRPKNLK